ncbi:MAG: flagellar assembly protein FliX [Geminicoccaceae bacterium]
MPALQASLLLTIQNAIPGERRRRNLARAETLLAGLEGLHQAIAAGEVDEGGLRTLGAALAQAGGDAPDPELADMLAAIELRVAVELAKLAS